MPITTRAELEEAQSLLNDVGEGTVQLPPETIQALTQSVQAARLKLAPTEDNRIEAIPEKRFFMPQAPGLETLGHGFMSGLKDVAAGVKQLGAEIAVQKKVPGASAELAEITSQRNAAAAMEEYQLRAARLKQGLDPDTALDDTGRILGQAAPEIFATMVTRGVPSSLARFAMDIASGTAGGAIQFTDDGQSRLVNTLTGLTFGTGASAVQNSATAAKNVLRKNYRRALLLPETEELRAAADDLGFRGAAEMTPSQASRSPLILSAEQRSDPGVGSVRYRRLSAQAEQVRANFEDLTDTLLRGENISTEAVILNVKNAAESRLDQLADIRATRWKDTMNLANEVSGGRPIMPVTETYNAFIDLLSDSTTRLGAPPRERMASVYQAFHDFAVRVQDGRVTADQFQQFMVDLNQKGKISGNWFQDLDKRYARHFEQTLRRAMMRDLDNAGREFTSVPSGPRPSTTLPVPPPDRHPSTISIERLRPAAPYDFEAAGMGEAERVMVAKLIKGARQGFTEDSAVIDQLRGTVIDRLFAKALPGVTEDTFAKRVAALPARDAKLLVQTLDSADPLLSDQVRGIILRDLVEQHKVIDDTAPGQLNIRGILKDLTGSAPGQSPTRGRASTFEVLFPDDTVANRELRRGLQVMNGLVFGAAERLPGGQPVEALAREMGVTMGSAATGLGNFGFLTRFWIGIQTPEQLEKFLFSPNGIERIRTLAKPGLTTAVAQDIMTQMVNDWFQGQTRDEQQKQRMELLQQQERAFERLATQGLPTVP